ncbi:MULTISPECIES: amidohydrolase [unclassified Thermococcus]|uniref:amidohydrolase n=1 Tax=unclassified Thermococcus TaxID=2627626 RepID=UPI00143BA414|nr:MULTISPECIES: amidohydrolase [unclassified Thermococcus]
MGDLIIKNVKAYTMGKKGLIEKANIIVKDNKIKKITSRSIAVKGKIVIDGEGLIALPGLIDPHTHLGIYPLEWEYGDHGVEKSDPITPHLKVVDGLDPFDPGFRDAIMGGITTVSIEPGSPLSWASYEKTTIMPGQSAILKTNGKIISEEAGIKIAVGGHVRKFLEELKMPPMTRMGILASIRTILQKAKEYAEKKEDKQYDPKLEALEKLIKNETMARIHVHVSRDILSIIKLLESFGVQKIIIEHGTEAYKVSEFLKDKNIPVILGPVIFPKRGAELRELSSKLPAMLYSSGVLFALTTDHPAIPIQYLTLIAAACVGDGLPYEEALKSITINAAKILGIDKFVGSLEEGKDADIVLFDGDPLDPTTKVVYTIIDGEIVYER